MPFLVNLSVEERKHLRTMKTLRVPYVREVNVTSNAHPDALAKGFDLAKYNKDKVSLEELLEPKVNHEKPKTSYVFRTML